MQKPKLLILIGGHLATAPRPQKESLSAVLAGFQVYIRGVWWDQDLASEDERLAEHLGVDFKPLVILHSRTQAVSWFKIRQRLSRELFRRLGKVTPRCLGLAGPEMLREARRIGADLTMVHSEVGLWVGSELMKEGFRVGVDFEDWFSRDLPAASREGRPIEFMQKLERELLRRAEVSFATTDSMATALQHDSGCDSKPIVIPNAFSYGALQSESSGTSSSTRRDSRGQNCVSFYWFSQTIGPGRGLEEVAAALPDLRGTWELHLRGNLRNYQEWFNTHFTEQVRERVHIHSCVSNQDLPFHSQSHDVGLALEMPHCESRELTASNKIFEYLRCGLFVLATPTNGQKEVLGPCSESGGLLASYDSEAIRQGMQSCISEKEQIFANRLERRMHSQEHWDWPHFSKVQADALKRAIGHGA